MSRCPARPEATLADLAATIDALAAILLRVHQHEAVAEPRGWSGPLEMVASPCGPDCSGYSMEPQAGHLWPDEEADPS